MAGLDRWAGVDLDVRAYAFWWHSIGVLLLYAAVGCIAAWTGGYTGNYFEYLWQQPTWPATLAVVGCWGVTGVMVAIFVQVWDQRRTARLRLTATN